MRRERSPLRALRHATTALLSATASALVTLAQLAGLALFMAGFGLGLPTLLFAAMGR